MGLRIVLDGVGGVLECWYVLFLLVRLISERAVRCGYWCSLSMYVISNHERNSIQRVGSDHTVCQFSVIS